MTGKQPRVDIGMTITRPSLPRIPLVSRDAYTPEQAALASGRDSYNLTRMFVNHPDFYRVFIPFVEKLMSRSLLPPRDREILILRTLELCDESYEENHHTRIALTLGMSVAEVEAAQTGKGAALGTFDLMLVRAAEELVNDRCMSDEGWGALAKRYTVEQMIEVVFLVGTYSMLSMATNSFGMPIDGSSGPQPVPKAGTR
jgi:alkylhydroperoxidase family enzyme